MKGIKKLSFIIKMIIITTTLMVLIGGLLIVASIKIQEDVLVNEMEKQAVAIAEKWGEEIDSGVVEESAANTNIEDKDQRELIEYFDLMSENIPNVAQGYILGTELKDGNKSEIISIPTHMIKALKEVNLEIGDFYEQPKVILKSIDELVHSKKTVTTEIYEDDFGTWVTVLYPIMNSTGEIFAYFGVDVDASMVKEGVKRFFVNSLLILIPAIIIIVLIQIFIIRKIAQPLKHLNTGISEMRKGNLDIHLPVREDDLGKMNEAFNEMALELKNMIITIKETSNTVLRSSELVTNVSTQSREGTVQVFDNIKQIASGIQTQEISVSESSNAIEQITSEIQAIASKSQDIELVSKEMESFAHQGVATIQNVVAQMESISTTVKDSSMIVNSLKERTDNINNILEVITGISNQTNLLALNAAIEAARAGENGKGFAVVADEVRKLAEESQQSAGKISRIIEEIQMETNNIVSAMVVGTKETSKGTEIAKTTGELFEKMKQFTEQISTQIEGVSTSAQEISAGSEEVTASVQELKHLAHQNSNLRQDIESSIHEQVKSINQLSNEATELNKLSQDLQSIISKFGV